MRFSRITFLVVFLIIVTHAFAGRVDDHVGRNYAVNTSKNLLLQKFYAKQIHLMRAWGVTLGDPQTTIAIVNSGLSFYMEEFGGKVAYEPDGSLGYDAVDNDMHPMDTHGEGTIISSIVAGRNLGVTPGARLIPIRVFDHFGNTSGEVIHKGIMYAIRRGARVLLMPLYEKSVGKVPLYCSGLEEAARQGMLVVVPVGNTGEAVTSHDYPVSCPGEFLEKNMITVTATDNSQALAEFSSYGADKVDVAAPGNNIIGIGLSGLPTLLRGTAAAASLTTGVSALVWAHHPDYTAAQVKEAIIKGARYRPTLEGKVKSNGMLDAYKAVTLELE